MLICNKSQKQLSIDQNRLYKTADLYSEKPSHKCMTSSSPIEEFSNTSAVYIYHRDAALSLRLILSPKIEENSLS